MKEFILPSRRKNWADPSVPSRCRADSRYTTDPGVASGPTAARYGLGNMVHCRPAWLGVVRVSLHTYQSSPARTEKSDYLLGQNSTVTVVDRGDLATLLYICGAPLDGEEGSEAAPPKYNNKASRGSQQEVPIRPVKNTHKHACLRLRVSRLLCFSSYHVRFDAAAVLAVVFTPIFFSGENRLNKSGNLTSERQKQGGRSGGEDTTVFLYRV